MPNVHLMLIKFDFVGAVQKVFLQKWWLGGAGLDEKLLARFGVNVLQQLFSEEEVDELIEFTE